MFSLVQCPTNVIIKYREVVYTSSLIAVGAPENEGFDARLGRYCTSKVSKAYDREFFCT